MAKFFFIAVVIIVIISVVVTFMRNQKISKEGIEADAVVSRIDTDNHTEEDGSTTTTETYYVQYKNAEGKTVEAKLGNPPAFAAVGTQMRVKYLADKPKYVIKV